MVASVADGKPDENDESQTETKLAFNHTAIYSVADHTKPD